jgi:hypothetical protein
VFQKVFRLFGPKREGVRGEQRTLHAKALHRLLCIVHPALVEQYNDGQSDGREVCSRELHTQFYLGSREEKDLFGDLGVDVIVILKMSRINTMKAWSGCL